MNLNNILFFDIETVGKYENIESFKLNDPLGFFLFEKKYNNRKPHYTDWQDSIDKVYLNKSGILPEYGKIVAIALKYIQNDEWKEKVFFDENEEKLIKQIHPIFQKVSQHYYNFLSGFNIKKFDIPWLTKKFIIYDLQVPKILESFNSKPWERNIYDLFEIWASGGVEYSSLEEVCYSLDINYKKKIQHDISLHSQYYLNRNYNLIKEYCMDDVNYTIKIAEKLLKYR